MLHIFNFVQYYLHRMAIKPPPRKDQPFDCAQGDSQTTSAYKSKSSAAVIFTLKNSPVRR